MLFGSSFFPRYQRKKCRNNPSAADVVIDVRKHKHTTSSSGRPRRIPRRVVYTLLFHRRLVRFFITTLVRPGVLAGTRFQRPSRSECTPCVFRLANRCTVQTVEFPRSSPTTVLAEAFEMNSSDSDDLGDDFLTDDTQNFLGQDTQDGVEMVTLDNTDDSSNQGEVYELKFGKPLREQDRFLPIANIAKIMKKSIPEGGKIAKDARECVQECVSEFISFITSEASDRCFYEKRKTINGEDILYAMSNLGFDNYVEPLKLYLQKYREATKGDKSIGIEELSDDVFSNDSSYSKMFGQSSQNENVIYYQDPIPQFHIE